MLLPLSFKFYNPDFLNHRLVLSILCAVPLEIAATVLYVRAISVSPLSLTIPFLSFTPLFLVITSYLMLGEKPSELGIIGIILVTFGAYTLNLEKMSITYPLKAVMREKGSLMMLLVAFLYSITSNLGKISIEASSPTFFASIYIPLLTVSYLVLLLAKRKSVKGIIKPNKERALIGLFIALSFFFHTQALNSTLVPYAISAKRTSLLFAIIYGALIFKEKGIRRKLVSGTLMLVGVFFISLSQM